MSRAYWKLYGKLAQDRPIVDLAAKDTSESSLQRGPSDHWRGGRKRSVRKLDRAIRQPLAASIAVIIVTASQQGSEVRIVFSVNTKPLILPILGLPKKGEHSEEGYGRGASLL